MTDLTIEDTRIPGLLVLRGGVQHNEDGWFKEAWHRQKMVALGLPDFGPVQHNVTHTHSRGITRGFHAEPWDRLVSVVSGRAMCAWVDLREGPGFGGTFHLELDPGTSVFVPRGVANAHQVLEDDTTLTYLLEHHWTSESIDRSRFINLFDPQIGIPWPIEQGQAIVSSRHELYPPLADVQPLGPRGVLLVGTETSLGRALASELPGARGVASSELRPDSEVAVDLSAFDIIINAHGELASGVPRPEIHPESWTQAAARAQRLADIAHRHNLTYVHVSADCRFGTRRSEYSESEDLDLNHPHGQALAAGELVAAGVPRSLVIRTGWVVGERDGFIDQMARAASRLEPVQIPSADPGRPTFVSQLAEAISFLLGQGATGTYNVTGDGRPVTWVDLAEKIFQTGGADPQLVQAVAKTPGTMSGTVLSLARVKDAGFAPDDSWAKLTELLTGVGGEPAAVEVASPHRVGPYKILFVCTANIARSAYADVVASPQAPEGVEFSSAGTHALVGRGIYPTIAQFIGERGDPAAHTARQLTRQIATDVELIITMNTSHRRYILDEWPSLGRKAYSIGQVARGLTDIPAGLTLDGLVSHLWNQRTVADGDIVTDPFGRGPEAALAASQLIDSHLEPIIRGLTVLAGRSERD